MKKLIKFNLLNKIILTRPYSWIGIILVGLLANILATNSFAPNVNLLADIFIVLLIWYTGAFFVEYFHRKVDGRNSTSFLIPSFLLTILMIALLLKNPLTLLFLLILIISSIIYSLKIKDWFLSGFSFLFRGTLEVCIFLMILFFHSYYDVGKFVPLLLTIYFLVSSRNLIGDVRDMKFDKYTFPKKYGVRTSYLVSLTLIFISIVLMQNIMITFPLLLLILVMIVCRDAYSLHRIFVITTTFFYMNYILFVLGQNILFTNILFIATLLNFTYPIVPRKSNPLCSHRKC